jgi:hypothetical protein
MAVNALTAPELTMVRAAVPEFESAFQRELSEEGPEFGAFQAMSAFAAWVGDRLREGQADDVTRRAFDAVEHLIADNGMPLGDALAAEFIEALWLSDEARTLMGPQTRARLRV